MRQVVKNGSSSVFGDRPNIEVFDSIAGQISARRDSGVYTVHVSSGAIAFGRDAIGVDSEEKLSIPKKQTLASIGQRILMNHWSQAYARYGYDVGQVLVTNEVLSGTLENQESHLIDLFEQQEGMLVQPVVNENDSVAVKEIVHGDNDKLSAFVANMVGARALFLLGTKAGILLDHDDPESRIHSANLSNDLPILEDICGDSNGDGGTGGMLTKLEAAKIFLSEANSANDKAVYIADARIPNVLALAEQGVYGTELRLAA